MWIQTLTHSQPCTRTRARLFLIRLVYKTHPSLGRACMSHCHRVNGLRNQTLLGMCSGHSEAMKGREGVAWQHLEQSMTPSLFGSLRMRSEKRGPQRDAQKLQVHSGAPLTPGFQGLQPTFPASPGCVSCHAVHTEGSVLLTPFHTSCFHAPRPLHMSVSFGKGSLPANPLRAPLTGSLFMEVADARVVHHPLCG